MREKEKQGEKRRERREPASETQPHPLFPIPDLSLISPICNNHQEKHHPIPSQPPLSFHASPLLASLPSYRRHHLTHPPSNPKSPLHTENPQSIFSSSKADPFLPFPVVPPAVVVIMIFASFASSKRERRWRRREIRRSKERKIEETSPLLQAPTPNLPPTPPQ